MSEIEFAHSEKQHLEIVVRGEKEGAEFFYHGFWPELTLKERMATSLMRLLDDSPATAHLRGRIERDETGFRMYLLVIHADGLMCASAQDPSPRVALKQTLDRMYTKISRWRRERFVAENGEDFLRSAARRVAATEQIAKPEFSPRILIVDDNPLTTKLIETCFKLQGCTTARATSGQEAVQKVTSDEYDLVVLDWQMPEMNGGEVLLCAQDIISYDSTFCLPWVTNHLPVVTYSGESAENLLVPRCENFDLLGHIPKSATYPELKLVTSNILELLRPA